MRELGHVIGLVKFGRIDFIYALRIHLSLLRIIISQGFEQNLRRLRGLHYRLHIVPTVGLQQAPQQPILL